MLLPLLIPESESTIHHLRRRWRRRAGAVEGETTNGERIELPIQYLPSRRLYVMKFVITDSELAGEETRAGLTLGKDSNDGIH